MSKSLTEVAVVADPSFGARVSTLDSDNHIWIRASPVNQPLVASLRDAGISVTTFRVGPEVSAEDAVLGVLPDVDLHHGLHSQDPAWESLCVFGAKPTDVLRSVLSDLGFNDLEPIPEGFRCSRVSEWRAELNEL